MTFRCSGLLVGCAGLFALGVSAGCSSSPLVKTDNASLPEAGIQTERDGGPVPSEPGIISTPSTPGPEDPCAVDGGCEEYDVTGDAGPACGNGIIEEGETCDDGNSALGDGCSGACKLEPNFRCEEEGEPCVRQRCAGRQRSLR